MEQRTSMIPQGTIQSLENEALNMLSNFDGEDGYEDYEDYEDYGYDGYNDDFLDFGGTDKSFRNEIASQRIYTFNIKQDPLAPAVATDAQFYILGGFKNVSYAAAAGVATGVMKEGQFTSLGVGYRLKATGVQCTWDQFQEFAKFNPTRVVGFKLSSTTASQLETMILEVEEQSPFRNLGTRQIVPSLYINEATYRDKIITIPEGFDLNNQISIKTTLRADSDLTVTFICGAVLNAAGALKTKADRAKRNIKGGPKGRGGRQSMGAAVRRKMITPGGGR